LTTPKIYCNYVSASVILGRSSAIATPKHVWSGGRTLHIRQGIEYGLSLVRAFLLLQHYYSSVYFELSHSLYNQCFVSNPFHKAFSELPPTLCLLRINCSAGRESCTKSEGGR
jgi:hypothetical protein